MKNPIKITKKYFQLIKEGARFKDKFAIFIYFIQAPIHYIFNKINYNFDHKLIFPVTLKNKDGIFFCGDNIFSAWCGSSSYELNSRKYFNIKGGVFIDIGANIGKYTIIMGKKLKNNGQVIAIEPEPNNFEILKKNIRFNKLGNIIPLKLACSSKKEKTDLYFAKFGSGGHSLCKDSKHIGKDKIKIQTKRLDNILSELNIKKINLIKIDVECAEAEVLKGATNTLKKYHPKIIFEAWSEKYLKKVEDILNPFNYKIKKIDLSNYFAH